MGSRLKGGRLTSLCASGAQLARLRAERYFLRRTCRRRKINKTLFAPAGANSARLFRQTEMRPLFFRGAQHFTAAPAGAGGLPWPLLSFRREDQSRSGARRASGAARPAGRGRSTRSCAAKAPRCSPRSRRDRRCGNGENERRAVSQMRLARHCDGGIRDAAGELCGVAARARRDERASSRCAVPERFGLDDRVHRFPAAERLGSRAEGGGGEKPRVRPRRRAGEDRHGIVPASKGRNASSARENVQCDPVTARPRRGRGSAAAAYTASRRMTAARSGAYFAGRPGGADVAKTPSCAAAASIPPGAEASSSSSASFRTSASGSVSTGAGIVPMMTSNRSSAPESASSGRASMPSASAHARCHRSAPRR